MTRISCTLHEDQHTFIIIPCWVLRTRNVSYKTRRESRTHVLCFV